MSRLVARLIRASMLADRALTRYDQARSFLVTCTASDEVLDAYNDLAYGATRVYDASAAQFRTALFNWEADLVRQVFPPPPGRVLVGGAGGGREAFELVGKGYSVTAFEPSPTLARSMADRAAQTGVPVEALLGRYQDLPILETVSGEAVDLTRSARFSAAMLGWSSFSHIRHRQDRVTTLQRFAALTDGPVVASFFLRPSSTPSKSRVGRAATRLGLRAEGDRFTPHIGYYHMSSREEIAGEVRDAGLVIVADSYNESDGYWPWVAVARPDVAASPPRG